MEKVQYKKSDFYYDLPEERIAQTPVEPRDSSRLLVYHKDTKEIENKIFRDVADYLKAGDVLVINNTKVIPARMYAKTAHGGVVEVLLLKRYDLNTWEVLMRPGKKGKIGVTMTVGDELSFTVKDITESLHENMSCSQHVGQLSHLLRIFNWLIKRHREVMRAKNCKVCIIRFLFTVH